MMPNLCCALTVANALLMVASAVEPALGQNPAYSDRPPV